MTHEEIDRIEGEIDRTNRMNVEQMVAELNIETTRITYLYVTIEGRLDAVEKPYPDTVPADEAKSIGYVRKLRGAS